MSFATPAAAFGSAEIASQTVPADTHPAVASASSDAGPAAVSASASLSRAVPLNYTEFETLMYFHERPPELQTEVRTWCGLGTRTVAEMLSKRLYKQFFFIRVEALMRWPRFIVWEEVPPEDFFVVPMDLDMLSCDEFLFFSHGWRTREHPDPDGVDLVALRGDIRTMNVGDNPPIRFVWIDFSCVPQRGESELERKFQDCSLLQIPSLVRECAFSFRYPVPDTRRRAWVFFEVATWAMTHTTSHPRTEDMMPYFRLFHQFCMAGLSVRDFCAAAGLSTAEEGDLTYIIRFLTIIFKIRSAYDTDSAIAGTLHLMTYDASGVLHHELNLPHEGLLINQSSAAVYHGSGSARREICIVHRRLHRIFFHQEQVPVQAFALSRSIAEAVSAHSERPTSVPFEELKCDWGARIADWSPDELIRDGSAWSQARELGEEINRWFGKQGMVDVLDYVRDGHQLRSVYSLMLACWDGIGDFMA